MGVSIGEAGEAFQAEIAAADRPLVGLLEHQGTDEADDDRSHNVAALGFEWSVAVARGRLRPRYGQGCGEVPLNLRWQPDLREMTNGGADAPAREEPTPS